VTSTSGPTLDRRHLGVGAPFAVAFGLALVTSSAVGIAPPAHPWMNTSVRQDSLPSPVPHYESLGGQTSSGLVKVNEAVRSAASYVSPSQRISEIRALAGLTIEQVGRLFGVSRRSVHNWINGNAMAPQHEEQARKILDVVRSLPGSSPDERRSALLDSSHGSSLFHELIALRGEPERLQTAGVSARERIGL